MTGRISDEAVIKATGKKWSEWFKLLDQAKAADWSHKQIAEYLYRQLKVPGWWGQMVANTYEQERGLRHKYQNAEGYQISVSKTFARPISHFFRTLAQAQQFQEITGRKVDWTTVNNNKNLRGKLADSSRLEIYFVAKDDKTQLVFQQTKIPSTAQAEKEKIFWRKILDKIYQ